MHETHEKEKVSIREPFKHRLSPFFGSFVYFVAPFFSCQVGLLQLIVDKSTIGDFSRKGRSWYLILPSLAPLEQWAK
jgi:hypothetical protein